jgi:RNA polymerase sigma-70 factor (ECF subfamily)
MGGVETEGRRGVGLSVLPVDKAAPPRPEELLARYQRRVYAVIYRMTGRHADVDDLCQEAFLQMIRSLPNFRPGTNLDSWAYRIAMNVAIDHLRRRGKDRNLEEGLRTRRGSAVPETELTEETSKAVREAIDALPPEQKSVVILRLYEGLSHEEIAGIVEAPVATVRWRYFTSLEKLESVLAPFVEPGEVGRELR